MSSPRLRCIVVDDHPAIVDAVSRYLEQQDGIDLVGRAADGAEALPLVEKLEPDVAILDVHMPHHGGLEIARLLDGRRTKTAVILYTAFPDRAALIEALDVGARGFLLKEAPLDDLMRAIQVVARGGTYVDAALAGVFATRQTAERLPSLSKREREILRMLADGLRNEDVALRLSISPHTVRTHVKNAMDKLEADTRTEAVASALRQSLIS
jgi:DNA-binding NarL/FixJ family response regulator